jgi:hypothetical protein
MRVRSLVAAFVMVFAILPLAAAAQGRGSDGSVYRLNNGRWMPVEGYGTRISIGPDGSPWVVNSRNEIYRWRGGTFEKMPGTALDIGIGGDGTPWIVGTDDGIYRWNGNNWDRQVGHGVSISVDRSGRPWVVNKNSEIFQWEGSRFIVRSGTARDIAAGDDVWIVGTDSQIYRRSDNAWMPMGGRGERISAGSGGTAWVVNETGDIFQWQNGEFRPVRGTTAVDIAANANGDVWIVGTASGATPRLRRPRNDRDR